MQTEQEENAVHLRVDLEGEEAQRFIKLRKKRGLRYNSELFRQVIKEVEDREL